MSGGKVFKFVNGIWEGKTFKEYKEKDHKTFCNIKRMLLSGAIDDTLCFEVRYFEVGPGGYSSLERHEHEHVVLVVKGRGKVLIGDEVYEVEPMDLVRIYPNTIHRFKNVSDTEPFGFICIVNKDRDRPTYPDEKEIQKLNRMNETKDILSTD